MENKSGVIIRPASEIEPYMKILVYGDPGAGKTTLAASAQQHEKMAKVLFVNVEGGLLSVRSSGVDMTAQIKHTDEVEKIFWQLANRNPPFDQYRTVIIDSGTELQTVNLENIVKPKADGTKRTEDDIFLEDYGKSTKQLQRIFRQFRDLPMNVVITALCKRIMPQPNPKNRDAVIHQDPLAVFPSFTEKLMNSLMGYMDFVWYMYQDKKGVRKMLTQPVGPYRAKSRIDGNDVSILEECMENPNLSEIYQTLFERNNK